MGFFSNLMGTTGEPKRAFIAPATRMGLFKLILKDRRIHMIPLNLLYAIFYIPCFAWLIYIFAGIEQQIGMGMSLFAPEILSWAYIGSIGFIPCSAVIGLGSVGMARVMRNWARDEHAFIAADFKDGIKKNWKQGILLGLLNGLIPVMVYWYAGFVLSNPGMAGIVIIPGVITVLVLLLWSISLGSMYVQAVTYDLSLGKIIKNGFIMNTAHFLTGLALLIAQTVPMIIFVLIARSIPELGFLLLTIWYLIFGLSFEWLIKASYANRLCEEFINAKAGLPVRIGLREE